MTMTLSDLYGVQPSLASHWYMFPWITGPYQILSSWYFPSNVPSSVSGAFRQRFGWHQYWPWSTGWGFLASQETKAVNATNVGLRDRKSLFYSFNISTRSFFSSERAALQWINRYIGNFGGDSSRVTLFVFGSAYLVSIQLTSTFI